MFRFDSIANFLPRWRTVFKIGGSRSLYFYCLLTGVVSGLGAYAFSRALAWGEFFLLHTVAGIADTHPNGEYYVDLQPDPTFSIGRWSLLFLPILGGLATGLLVYRFSRESAGTGTDSMIDSFHNKEGKMAAKVPLVKSIATIFTLSTGGSGGKEGPISQIGAGFGSVVATLIHAGARARRTLLLAGTAGGLGAIFHAPLGGALTSVEMIYREDIESDSLIPCIISSVTAYLTYSGLNGFGSVYKVPEIGFEEYPELIFYAILGILCFWNGSSFIRIFRKIQDWSEQWPVPDWLKPAIGGIPVGIIGFFLPEVIGTGSGVLQDALDAKPIFEPYLPGLLNGLGISKVPDSVGLQEGGVLSVLNLQNDFAVKRNLLLALFFFGFAFLKMLTTSFTIGTGGSAGMFGPALFIGGMLGGAVGTIAKIILITPVSVSSFILVGMGAFYAGIASAPIAGMVMICEIIGSYSLLPPLMVVSIIAFVLSHRLSLYKSQKENRFQSPAHYWDMNRDVLESISIGQVSSKLRNIAVTHSSKLLSELEQESISIHASDYVVLDDQKKYLGMLSLRKIRHSPESMEFAKDLITVGDATDSSVPAGSIDQSLASSLKLLVEFDLDKIAVVQDGKCLGYLRYAELMKVYFETTLPKKNQSLKK
ncbi:chloride transporter, ClC family [Leptospira broomii serovar Hurstbridge str. 5399]|uniref:Chloride transporter, ClC family n=1 Tax=Leptospira broomii serovar Hurstbridge str. 5399 TaxID=1049789 RepID=T0FED6_9LEPT|nr:chloride channel protein [Leptospira broomii]EQA46236.1 chloride transporter, ClC family [Leptospira broomii serovar Hurstbridge str. 5399]